MAGIYEKLVSIIEDVTDIPGDEIQEESSFIDDLDLASLEIMSIVSKVEKQFSVLIGEDDLLKTETVSDMVKVIAEKC